MKHGNGKLSIKVSGDTYDGDWQRDKMTGQGKYTFSKEKKRRFMKVNFVKAHLMDKGQLLVQALSTMAILNAGSLMAMVFLKTTLTTLCMKDSSLMEKSKAKESLLI